MKYIHKELDENVNVSDVSPLREFVTLLGGLLALMAIIYVVLGFSVEYIVLKYPDRLEGMLASVFSKFKSDRESTPLEATLQSLTDDLSGEEGKYIILLINSPDVNAAALPGGTIIILSDLLGFVESENELSFVLAHEIGHFQNHDHLRGLGRGLVFIFMSTVMLGDGSDVTQFIANRIKNIEMRFTQRQEMQADIIGLELLQKKYGHSGGATDFFKRIEKIEPTSRFAHFVATHPHPDVRIKAIEELISTKGYETKAILPRDYLDQK